MAKFNLTSDGKSYAIDTDGSVSTSVGPFGTWTTNADNQIVVKKTTGGASLKIDVGWQFNASNQLCLFQGSEQIFNFASGGARPRYRLANNVLQIRPSGSLSFEFFLYGKWELDDKINLKVTIGKLASKLEGWADDKKSRFIYWFRDKQVLGAPYSLDFSGAWERDEKVNNEIRLVFNFEAEGTKGRFVLPGRALVDSARNLLYLEYQKDGVTRRIEMRGSLEISKDLDLIFTISRQTNAAGGVLTKETQIAVKTTFTFDNLSGGLELFVGKAVTPTSQKFAIGGAFKATFGDRGLDLHFSYAKTSELGRPAVVAIAANGCFTWNSEKNLVEFSYEREGGMQKLTLKSNFMLGNVRTEVGLNITKDGKQYGVYGFLGLSW